MADGVASPGCSMLTNALHGSSTLFFEAQTSQALAFSTVTKSYNLAYSTESDYEEDVLLKSDIGSEPFSRTQYQGSWSTEKWLSWTGNFSSGAADVLTLSGTYWIQRAMGTSSLVNRQSLTYHAGVLAGIALGTAIGEEALSDNPVGLRINYHEKPHPFGNLGKLSHNSSSTGRQKGVPGSGGAIRIPLPWGP